MTDDLEETTRLTFSAADRRDDGDTVTFEFTTQIPEALRWFRGHFDSNPVLPAMVQLREALSLVRSTWPDLHSLRRITRAKFHARIRPSETLRLRLRRVGRSGKAGFEYLRGTEMCSSGVLEFATREVSEVE